MTANPSSFGQNSGRVAQGYFSSSNSDEGAPHLAFEMWGTLIRNRSDLGHPPGVGRTKERATTEPDFVVIPPCPTAGQDGAPSSVVGVEIAKARVGHPPMAKVGHPPDGGKRQLCLGESGDMIVVA